MNWQAVGDYIVLIFADVIFAAGGFAIAALLIILFYLRFVEEVLPED